MILLVTSFFVAFLVTMLLVWSAARHAHVSGDTDKSQPQKFHDKVVPRIGGVGIMCGVVAGTAFSLLRGGDDGVLLGLLVVCGVVAFGAGLIEDFTKKVSPLQRLLATMAAAGLAIWLVGVVIPRTDIPGLSHVLQFSVVVVLLTLIAVAGVANSVNIIDGFNGLASMCVAIMLAAVAYVAFKVGDQFVMHAALITLGAVLGFFVWNYPRGLIFLGDGGAYFLGFWVAELSILLIKRNETVSPLFPLMVCAYPIFETLFTMYRRKIIRGRPVGQPDASHLHSLIYRRTMRWASDKGERRAVLTRNSMTSPYLWLLCSLAVFPVLVWWSDSAMLAICLGGFCVLYVVLYRSIVRFRSPRFLFRPALTPSISRPPPAEKYMKRTIDAGDGRLA
jgi:UDP-N-acetylmuramyl pentapeptide phosphotransferase/UDP-N-acetylglucosamine-1-phosphate transferase